MSSPDWSSFKRKIYINAPMDAVYKAWATSEGLEDWFLENASYSRENSALDPTDPAQENDAYMFKWYHWESEEHGSVLAANGADHFAFTFDGMRVDIELASENGMTLCTLTQSEIPTDEKSKLFKYWGCGSGWTFFMANLKAVLEHGVNLIDKQDGLYGEHDGMVYVNN